MDPVSVALLAIVHAYLSFTTYLADMILQQFEPVFTETTIELSTPSEEPVPPSLSAAATEPISIIPRVLIDHSAFQRDGAVAGVSSDVTATTSLTAASVNIFCTKTTDTTTNTLTGSGFFISPSGAILTNAHVAQFLLLEDSTIGGTTECVIRTGSPAVSTYRAELLYLPPSWIQAHAHLITAEVPQGTGERDYALIYPASRTDNSPLPARFPYLQLSLVPLSPEDYGREVVVSGYPAHDLIAQGPSADLLFRSASTTLNEVFTFGNNEPDVLSLGETEVSAAGASGGAVVNTDRQVLGVISTQGQYWFDSLRAISIPYINRTILEETGFTLTEYLNADLPRRATIYNEAIAPFLRQLLEFELRKE